LRHGVKKGRKFNRDLGQRRALLKGLAKNMIDHGVVETTIDKAKETKAFVDKLMKFAKKGSINDRRILISRLSSKDHARRLIEEIAPRFTKRISGFTSVQRTKKRAGDNSQLAVIKWVTPLKDKEEKESKEIKIAKAKPKVAKEKVVKEEVKAKKVVKKEKDQD